MTRSLAALQVQSTLISLALVQLTVVMLARLTLFSWSLHSASDANLIGRTSSPNKKKRKKEKYPRSRLFFMNAARNVAPGPSKNKKKPQKLTTTFHEANMLHLEPLMGIVIYSSRPRPTLATLARLGNCIAAVLCASHGCIASVRALGVRGLG